MKSKNNIQSFGEFKENLNISDASDELPREPMFEFKYNDEGVFYNIFDDEKIESEVRKNEGLT